MLSQTIALKRIADCITDIDIENLSKAENQIGRILKDEGIVVEKENNGETCYIIKGLADSAIALGIR